MWYEENEVGTFTMLYWLYWCEWWNKEAFYKLCLYLYYLPIECLTDSFERRYKTVWQYISSKDLTLTKKIRGLFLLLQNVIPRLSPNRLPTFPWISCKYCHFKESHSLCTWNQHCIRLVRDRCYWFARTGVIISIAQRYWVEVCWVGIMDEWEGTCLTKESQQLTQL